MNMSGINSDTKMSTGLASCYSNIFKLVRFLKYSNSLTVRKSCIRRHVFVMKHYKCKVKVAVMLYLLVTRGVSPQFKCFCKNSKHGGILK